MVIPEIKTTAALLGNFYPDIATDDPFRSSFDFYDFDQTNPLTLYQLLYNDGVDDSLNNIIKSYAVAIPEELKPSIISQVGTDMIGSNNNL